MQSLTQPFMRAAIEEAITLAAHNERVDALRDLVGPLTTIEERAASIHTFAALR